MGKSVLRKSQRVYLFFKRLVDLVGSLVGIILLSPVLLICAIITKCTSKGPIFFRQERLGKNKKVFRIFKFRSMRADAPEIAPSDMTIEQQKAMEYRWGRFMRKTSLDEIPQLFNIFVGDMSFIGPRPGAAHNEEELVKAREAYSPNLQAQEHAILSFSLHTHSYQSRFSVSFRSKSNSDNKRFRPGTQNKEASRTIPAHKTPVVFKVV